MHKNEWGKNKVHSSIQQAHLSQGHCGHSEVRNVEEGGWAFLRLKKLRLSRFQVLQVLALIFLVQSFSSQVFSSPLLDVKQERQKELVEDALVQRNIRFNIPQQRADLALTLFAEQANLTLVFPFDDVKEKIANQLVGQYSLQEAAKKLLAGTGLFPSFGNQLVLTITTEIMSGDEDMNRKKNILAATIAFFMGAGGGSQVLAQEESGQEGVGLLLEEVVVTAQKREASMQDVPISISAFSGDRLEQSGIENAYDLEMVTPGLSFSSDLIQGNIFIRGVGSTKLAGPGTDPSSSTYIDGVYQGQTISAVVDILDVERIEVLKGPQGTLYGRNSTGGAIKYISKKPSNEFGGKLKAEAGNYNNTKLSATVDMPLIEDTLLLRAAVLKQDRDGYTKIINHSGEGNDREDLAVGRFTLQYIPSDDLEVLIHGTAVNNEGDGPAFKLFIGPGADLFETAQIISDPRQLAVDFGPSEVSTRTRAIDASIIWDIGTTKFTSVTAYSDLSTDPFFGDEDATDVEVWGQGRPATEGVGVLDGFRMDAQTFSQDLILASSGQGKVDWTVGANYFEADNFAKTGFFADGLGLVDVLLSDRIINKTKAYAGFGDFTYSLTDSLRLNAGIRYSSETKEFSTRNETDGVIGTFSTREESWSEWTPKFGLDYSFTDDVMAYFSLSRGFKSGAFYADAPPVEPEFITAYEIGVKSMLWDDRLRLNASAFNYDYEDLQVQTLNETGDGEVINNAGKADIQGLEVSATALLSESFQMDVGLSWLDAEYTEFLRLDLDNPGETINLKGNKLSQAPEFTANIALSYNRQIDDVGNLQARVDYYYSAEKHFNEFNDLAMQDDYELVNARIGFQSQDNVWDIALFGKNLTDELVFSHALSSRPWFGANTFRAALTPPRTYGVSVAYNF